MKKILSLLIINLLCAGSLFAKAELSPEYMLSKINDSSIKTPAKIVSVKTLQSKKGYKIQLVEFKGLYENEGKTYKAKSHNFDTEPPKSNTSYRKYLPKNNDRVYVTIDKDNGEITSMVTMDKKFEQKLQKTPKLLKFDCNGAYFEE